MEEKIIRCPICAKIVSIEKGCKTQQIENVNGICWDEFGYSLGGWGYRNNFMKNFSGEICDECFYVIKSKIDELIEVIKKRKNSCEEGICIYKTSKNTTESYKVSEMQSDELQSERYKKPLLRLLSRFL